MNNKLEEFLRNNKDDFDGYEPSEAMWDRIEKRIAPTEKKGLVVRMGTRKLLSAAAAIVIFAVATFLYFSRKQAEEIKSVGPIARTESSGITDRDTSSKLPENTVATTTEDKDTKTLQPLTPIKNNDPVLANNDALQSIASEELVHYTKLVELKQQQITILKKDEPLLYKQFATDFERIDKEFDRLKKQNQSQPNNEQLLEAMLQNLHLQSALLSRQLEIIKNINNNKKKRYEKTYNSTI